MHTDRTPADDEHAPLVVTHRAPAAGPALPSSSSTTPLLPLVAQGGGGGGAAGGGDRGDGPRPTHPSLQALREVLRFGVPLALLAGLVLFLTAQPEVYLATPSASTAQPGANRTVPVDAVRLFSLNVYVLPTVPDLSPFRAARLHALLPHLSAVDLLCLQELYWVSADFKPRFIRAIRPLGLSSVAAAPSFGLRGLFRWPPKLIDAGLTIASARRIVRADYHVYRATHPLSIDFVVAKSVLYARVQTDTPGRRFLHVFTTHLQANNGLPLDFAGVRARQLRELRAFVARCVADEVAAGRTPVVLVAGDFNVDGRAGFGNASSSAEYESMMATLRSISALTTPAGASPALSPRARNAAGGGSAVTDVLLRAMGGRQPVTSAGGLDGASQKNERLDYVFLDGPRAAPANGSVFVNELLAARGAPYRTLSDHYAVQATIEVGDERGTAR